VIPFSSYPPFPCSSSYPLFSHAAAQSTLPPLPHLAIDAFPSPTRDALIRPYRDASARPGDAEAVGGLARALQAWEQWSAAHEAYLRAHALAPRTFAWSYLDAVVLQRLARHAEAAAGFEHALRLDPDYLPARVKLAEALLDAGQPEHLAASARLFEALIDLPLSKPAAEFGLGRIEAARGHQEAAIDHLQRAVALFPGGAPRTTRSPCRIARSAG
jgi:tetratricopeptide (TPR) repeat protein